MSPPLSFLTENQSDSTAIIPRRFSVDEYHRMAELGLLTEEDRVELLEGVISPKIVHSPIHDATVSVVEQFLRRAITAGWFLRVQSAVTLQSSEPEPDIAVVKGPPARYATEHPGGSDIALAVEVAETSLSRDQAKAVTYAAGGIECYWIVNIKAKSLVAYDCLDNGIYTRQQVLTAGKKVQGGHAFQANTSFLVDDLLVS